MPKLLNLSVFRNVTGLLSSLCLSALLPGLAFAQNNQDNSVDINKTQILRLPAPAAAIVVGNPAIADISVHSPTLLFVLGRGYGVTNVIVLDEFDNVIMDTNIQVGNSQSDSSKRLMMAGQGWQSFDCTPFCQPAPVLGDDPQFLANFKGQDKAVNNSGIPITASRFSGQLSGASPNTGIQNSTLGSKPNADPRRSSRSPM